MKEAFGAEWQVRVVLALSAVRTSRALCMVRFPMSVVAPSRPSIANDSRAVVASSGGSDAEKQ